ncbi:tyrosine-type recombinase/integrase [Rhizorhabdus argentea]|uniref:tyrosine-type recombinase/integrase n=1 Tax=Rhizorhabdus argentea TaxID=1387174 RepID=UPI0030EF730C
MGSIQSFTPSSIDSLSEGKRSDPLIPGLYIQVVGKGRKVWRYRRRVTKSHTIVTAQLGYFPAFAISAARKWAAAFNEAVERGEDPRVALRAEASRKAMTVEKAHGLYMAAMRRGDRKRLKPRTIKDKEVIFTRDIESRLGSLLLDDLTEDECWDAVYDKAEASKVRANKMAGELSCFLRWCSGREGQMAGIKLAAHPAPTLNSNWFDTGPKANQRFLNHEELKWLFQALVPESLPYRRGFVLLLLTAARRNELFGAATSEVAGGVWMLPGDRSKNNEPNFVALGPWSLALAQTNHVWLFPSPRVDGPQLSGWFKVRDRVHARMEELAGRSIPSWHFHDFRRTFRSNARRLGIDRDIAELMLNHKRRGIEGVYDKNAQLDLRADGFRRWEEFLLSLVECTSTAEALMCPRPDA